MKYKNSRTGQNFLKKFLLRMVALVLMALAPLQLKAADVIISTTADPTLLGTQDTVGAIALWENAGTIDGVSIDLRATITATDANTVKFYTDLDDPTLKLTSTAYGTVDAYVTIKWEIFRSGTNQTVAAVGTPTVGMVDIDGIDGPDTREAISASLTGLSGYIVDNPTNLAVDVVPGSLNISGTENESYGSPSLVILNYNEVSSWDITYKFIHNTAYYNAVFYNDLDGDETLVDPKTEVVFLRDINLTKTSDASGDLALGDTITYTITAENNGTVTLHDVVVTDTRISPNTTTCAELNVSDMCVLTGTYTVTQADVDAGTIFNSATADSNESNETESNLTIPVSQNPSIAVVKTGTFMDENGDGYADVGETVHYDFNVTNTGNVLLVDINLTDENATITGELMVLDVGESNATAFTGTHVITLQDIIEGEILNQAVIKGISPNSTEVNATSDDPETTAVQDATVVIVNPRPPYAVDDNVSVDSGNDAVIDVLADDEGGTFPLDPTTVQIIDPETGDPVSTLTIVGEGNWTVDPTTGEITFTPEEGYVGDPTPIEYTVEDTQGNISSATIRLDYPPVANDDSNTSLPQGETATLMPLTNDQNTSMPLDPESVSLVAPDNATDILVDAEGDVIGFAVPNEGTWRVDEQTGEVTFEPDYALTGDPTPIGYTVSETGGQRTNEAELSISYLPTAHLEGTYWIDGNDNNIIDDGEEPMANVTVELLDENGNLVSTAITDENGTYEFDVNPGDYQIRLTLPQDMADDLYEFNTPDGSTIIVNGTTLTSLVTVGNGENVLDIDASINCGCADAPIQSSGGDTLGVLGFLFMILVMLGSGLLFMRTEEIN